MALPSGWFGHQLAGVTPEPFFEVRHAKLCLTVLFVTPFEALALQPSTEEALYRNIGIAIDRLQSACSQCASYSDCACGLQVPTCLPNET